MTDPLTGVSRETVLLLRELETFFRQWAGRMNLVSRSTLEVVWDRHILDSIQLIHFAPTAVRWLDLGSGGGFPGLVLAAVLRERTGTHVDLVEKSRKKAVFLNAAISALRLPATVHVAHIEEASDIPTPEIITARAVAPLAPLLGLSQRWLLGRTRALFHKGRNFQEEVRKSRERWAFELVVHPSMTEEGAAILEIANLRSQAE